MPENPSQNQETISQPSQSIRMRKSCLKITDMGIRRSPGQQEKDHIKQSDIDGDAKKKNSLQEVNNRSNYMKPTRNSDKKMESSQVSSDMQASNSNQSPSQLTCPTKTTSSKCTSMKSLLKCCCLRPKGPPMKASGLPLLVVEDITSRTCSSTSKDSEVPDYSSRATEPEGTSVMKVCSYNHCSLDGHCHKVVSPLKRFQPAKRRSAKAEKSTNLGGDRQCKIKHGVKGNTKVDVGNNLVTQLLLEEEGTSPLWSHRSWDNEHCDLLTGNPDLDLEINVNSIPDIAYTGGSENGMVENNHGESLHRQHGHRRDEQTGVDYFTEAESTPNASSFESSLDDCDDDGDHKGQTMDPIIQNKGLRNASVLVSLLINHNKEEQGHNSNNSSSSVLAGQSSMTSELSAGSESDQDEQVSVIRGLEIERNDESPRDDANSCAVAPHDESDLQSMYLNMTLVGETFLGRDCIESSISLNDDIPFHQSQKDDSSPEENLNGLSKTLQFDISDAKNNDVNIVKRAISFTGSSSTGIPSESSSPAEGRDLSESLEVEFPGAPNDEITVVKEENDTDKTGFPDLNPELAKSLTRYYCNGIPLNLAQEIAEGTCIPTLSGSKFHGNNESDMESKLDAKEGEDCLQGVISAPNSSSSESSIIDGDNNRQQDQITGFFSEDAQAANGLVVLPQGNDFSKEELNTPFDENSSSIQQDESDMSPETCADSESDESQRFSKPSTVEMYENDKASISDGIYITTVLGDESDLRATTENVTLMGQTISGREHSMYCRAEISLNQNDSSLAKGSNDLHESLELDIPGMLNDETNTAKEEIHAQITGPMDLNTQNMKSLPRSSMTGDTLCLVQDAAHERRSSTMGNSNFCNLEIVTDAQGREDHLEEAVNVANGLSCKLFGTDHQQNQIIDSSFEDAAVPNTSTVTLIGLEIEPLDENESPIPRKQPATNGTFFVRRKQVSQPSTMEMEDNAEAPINDDSSCTVITDDQPDLLSITVHMTAVGEEYPDREDCTVFNAEILPNPSEKANNAEEDSPDLSASLEVDISDKNNTFKEEIHIDMSGRVGFSPHLEREGDEDEIPKPHKSSFRGDVSPPSGNRQHELNHSYDTEESFINVQEVKAVPDFQTFQDLQTLEEGMSCMLQDDVAKQKRIASSHIDTDSPVVIKKYQKKTSEPGDILETQILDPLLLVGKAKEEAITKDDHLEHVENHTESLQCDMKKEIENDFQDVMGGHSSQVECRRSNRKVIVVQVYMEDNENGPSNSQNSSCTSQRCSEKGEEHTPSVQDSSDKASKMQSGVDTKQDAEKTFLAARMKHTSKDDADDDINENNREYVMNDQPIQVKCRSSSFNEEITARKMSNVKVSCEENETRQSNSWSASYTAAKESCKKGQKHTFSDQVSYDKASKMQPKVDTKQDAQKPFCEFRSQHPTKDETESPQSDARKEKNNEHQDVLGGQLIQAENCRSESVKGKLATQVVNIQVSSQENEARPSDCQNAGYNSLQEHGEKRKEHRPTQDFFVKTAKIDKRVGSKQDTVEPLPAAKINHPAEEEDKSMIEDHSLIFRRCRSNLRERTNLKGNDEYENMSKGEKHMMPAASTMLQLTRSYSDSKQTRNSEGKDLIEFMSGSRKSSPRKPWFLQIPPWPPRENVVLRHQTIDKRKNPEEWMLDHALRQTVSRLAPIRKKRVAMLIEAFEKVMPIPKSVLHSCRSAIRCAHARTV